MKKIVVNDSCFGFKLPEEYAKARGIHIRTDDIAIRTDSDLIAIVEADTYKGDLITVELPDNYTDVDIIKYDGTEDIVAVVNGKLVYPWQVIVNKR